MFRLALAGSLILMLTSNTLVSAQLCASCMPRSVTLIPADGTKGSITPTIKVLPNTPQGCRQMNIICKTPAGFTRSNMIFNGEGPPKSGKDVTALVSCFKASWHTSLAGSYIYVDTVKCRAT
uniref:C6 domain-containing protein n=1 Tax=Haemonchus contortus TaxID=6289 RepID=A0A7I4YQZ7_HAECO